MAFVSPALGQVPPVEPAPKTVPAREDPSKRVKKSQGSARKHNIRLNLNAADDEDHHD